MNLPSERTPGRVDGLRLTLQDVDLHVRLVVVGGGEDLRLAGRDRRVAFDQLREDPALRLDAEREGRDVQEQDVLHVALQHTRLDRCTDRDDLVRVDPLVRLLATRQVLHELLDHRHARRAADHDDVVDLVDGLAPVLHRELERLPAALHQVLGHALELAPRELHLQVQRTVGARRDERQVDRRLADLGQFDLRLLRGLLQPLERHPVVAEVDAVVVLELLDHPIDDPLVPVVAAELRVAVRRLDLEDALPDLEQRHVERATPEVEHEDRLVVLLVQPVRERGGRGLVDDPQHVEARDLAGLLRGLALRVVEVRGDGDHRLVDGVAQVGLGVALQLAEDLGGDLLRRPLLAVDLEAPVLRAHVALDGSNGAIRVRDRLPLGDLADDDLAVLREPHDRRRRPRPLDVRSHDRLAGLQHGDHRVGRPQIDPHRSRHPRFLLRSRRAATRRTW